ncbi:peptidylprolyl isomerase [Gluconacetobacter azotocaptans]|uniref:Parvulin-like PPIase n=1 Tax=Gluconacetobacter azotocaptans TaxID=142834 RepID=A0A7W4JSM2_9PROT|nr:peptidylprolyl isomerase [Gluconacetobacter azotocaptans]MBB2190144.1 peptidylprolyl isomerase [Gluconacetobacter azotocaptans]GBQ27282.1 peptidyl-prolyl cis-trans isomerase [Gluconacetobacter azotocaptans DSM 13594]
MRLSSPAASFMAAALLAPALFAPHARAAAPAATPAAPAAAPAAASATPAAPANPNPVVATVNGEDIHLDDVRQAAATMPAQLRQLPPNMIFPMLLNQLIDQKAIQAAALRTGLQNQPDVQAQMHAAATNALQNAYLSQQVAPTLTDAAIQDYYNQNYANKKPETEVHARHILVATEAEATGIIKQLKAGADFGALATKLSTDKASAKQNGGDLGWFKKGDMLPAFSDAAFAMKPHTFSQTPVHSQYGWHVIEVLDTRTAAVPKLDAVHDEIRQKLIQQGVRQAVDKAVAGVTIVRYDPSGKPIPATPPAKATPAKK